MKYAAIISLVEAIDFALTMAAKLRPVLDAAIGELTDAERQQLYADHDASIQRLDDKARSLGLEPPKS